MQNFSFKTECGSLGHFVKLEMLVEKIKTKQMFAMSQLKNNARFES